MRPRTLTITCALLGAGVSLIVLAVPALQFAYRNPTAHIVLETTEAMIAFLTAYLALGRYRQTGRSAEAAAGYSFIVLGLANLLLSAGPEILRLEEAETFSTWAPLFTRLIGVAGLVYAAWNLSEERRAGARGSRVAWVVVDAVATVAAVAVVVLLLRDSLPVGVQTEVPPDASRPSFESHPGVLAAQLLSILLFAAAAVGFTIRAEREPDELVRWFAAGSALGAAARFSYVLYPSLYSDYVYIGDLVRLASYGLFLLGASREIYSYRSGVAEAEALRERTRLAHSLHDGIAQELTFIGAQTRRMLRAQADSTDLQMLASAADRAGAETRRAIRVLSRTEPLDLPAELAEVVEEVCRRVGARVELHLSEAAVDAGTAEALVRIVREAATNAVRHGGAEKVSLQVTQSEGMVTVTVEDDGSGFDPAEGSATTTGFGLTFIRQRTRAVEGELTIESRIGEGTVVQVKVPAWVDRRR